MTPILAIVQVLSSELSLANLVILSEISKGVFRLTSSVTGLNISRYTDKWAFYRNMQRFFASRIRLGKAKNAFIFKIFIPKRREHILAADEYIEDKSGKSTFGLAYFFRFYCRQNYCQYFLRL